MITATKPIKLIKLGHKFNSVIKENISSLININEHAYIYIYIFSVIKPI